MRDDVLAVTRQPLGHPTQTELDRRMWLAHAVQLAVEALDRIVVRERRQPFTRDGVDERELLGHLHRKRTACVLELRPLHDPAPDRLPADPFHDEGLSAGDLTEVGDRLRSQDARLAGRVQHLELVAERESPSVDHASPCPPHEQLPPVLRVDRPSFLRSPSGEQDGPLDLRPERLLERLFHRASSAIARRASTCGVETRRLVAPDSRHAASRSAMRSFGPTSATSSTKPSGTATAASRFRPSR